MIDEKLFDFIKVELDKLGIGVTKGWGGRYDDVLFQRYDNPEDYFWIACHKLITKDLSLDLKKEYVENVEDKDDILWNNLIAEIKKVLRAYKISITLNGED